MRCCFFFCFSFVCSLGRSLVQFFCNLRPINGLLGDPLFKPYIREYENTHHFNRIKTIKKSTLTHLILVGYVCSINEFNMNAFGFTFSLSVCRLGIITLTLENHFASKLFKSWLYGRSNSTRRERDTLSNIRVDVTYQLYLSRHSPSIFR